MERKDKIILFLSTPLVILTAFVSYAGIFIQSTYSRETMRYAAQGIGQDIVTLFIVVPLFIISSFLAYRKNKIGLFLWSGILFYLAYSYTLYTFGSHFNDLFIAYCLILGLSFYSFVYFLFNTLNPNISAWFREKYPRKSVAIFLFFISGTFYYLWLSEIISAMMKHQVPSSIIENGLLTNPIYVIDLAICLPALILTGIFLLKKKQIGLLLAPTMLTFSIMLAIAISAMVIVMKIKGFEANITETAIFGAIIVTGITLLIMFFRSLKIKKTSS